MINSQLKEYQYLTYSSTLDSYGQEVLTSASGTIKMAINLLSETVKDNVLYTGANYIGLTMNSTISDKDFIVYDNDYLKVLYVNLAGRYKQVYMTNAVIGGAANESNG